MNIRYFATIRDYTHEMQCDWRQPAATLRELLAALSARYGNPFARAVVDEDGDLGPHIIILINGRDARHQGGIDAPLKPDDTVSIFPMVAGG